MFAIVPIRYSRFNSHNLRKKKFRFNGGAPSRAPPPPYPYRAAGRRPAVAHPFFGGLWPRP